MKKFAQKSVAILVRFKAPLVLGVLMAGTGILLSGLSGNAPETEAADESAPAASSESTKTEVAKTADPSPENSDKVAPVAAAAPSAISPAMSARAKGCITDEAAIDDMRKARTEVADQQKKLAARESELQAREKAVDEKIQELDKARDEIKNAQALNDSANEEKIAKLVEMFESMSPKSAALIVNDLDDALSTKTLSRVNSAKLGKILGAMAPEKSAHLIELLAGVVRARKHEPASPTSQSGAAVTTLSMRGGETENGNIKQQQFKRGGGSGSAVKQPEPAVGREPASKEGG